MSELLLGGIVALVGLASWWQNRRRPRRPGLYWLRAWLFVFATGAVFLVGGDAPGTEPVLLLLSPFSPALFLAGALAYAHRSVPAWILPVAFGLGLLRGGLTFTEFTELNDGIGLATEPVALAAAAVFAFGASRRAPRRSPRRLLAPAFIALALVEVGLSVVDLGHASGATPVRVAWFLVTPFAALVQIGVVRDLAHGRRLGVERALSESQERFRTLTENAFDLIAEMDVAGHFTYTNPRYDEWFEVGAEGLAGMAALDVIHPDDVEHTRAWFRNRDQNSTGALLTMRLHHKDLGWRWVECSGRSYSSGGKVHIVASSRDVTERIQMEHELQDARDRLEERVVERTGQLHQAVADLEAEVAERRRVEHERRLSEARWRDVSNLSSDLSFAVTRAADGTFHTDWVTEAVTRISGRTREEIEVAGWTSVIHPEDLELVLKSLIGISDGETHEFVGRIITPMKSERWMRVRIHGESEPEGGGVRILGAARDITEARKAVDQRIELEAHIREAQKLESLGVLAGGVAHDFNNVLAVILGNDALALADAEPGSRLAKQLQRIREAAKHGQALTNQMLTYSGKATVSLKPLDLYQLVVDMSELLDAAVSKNCRLSIEQQNGPTVVEGDPTQLRQVIMNLAANASESLQDRSGRVAVRCGMMTATAEYLQDTFGTADLAAGPYVFLEVSDPGHGIDDGVRKRIFEPFFSTKFTGRGLGLASVLGIVRGHHGAVKLTSSPGVGTRFRVLIPPATEAMVQPPLPLSARTKPSRSGCILVVDDDDAVVEVAAEFLKRAGFAVQTAGGGRAAIALLEAPEGAQIDAVVLDLSMPDLDGRETLLEIRRLSPTLPVIVASGFDENAGGARLAAADIAAFIRKPYEPEELVDAVRNSLQN